MFSVTSLPQITENHITITSDHHSLIEHLFILHSKEPLPTSSIESMQNQIQNSKETNSVEFKYNIDGTVEKNKLNVYEDGNDEAFLNMYYLFLVGSGQWKATATYRS